MNILNYKYLVFSISFLILILILLLYALSASAHEGKVHEIVDSEEQKQKLQECLTQPTFQDSCFFELCENRNPYFCAEDIIEAVVMIADPQKAMDVLKGIMDSRLFSIQTDGHLLSHIIGNTIAHRYGFSGESFLKCPQGFNWGCTHGFFEDALEVEKDPGGVAVEICESGLDHPSSRKELCYHGIGHMFLFNESYDITSALALCDQIPSQIGQERCWDGVFMQKNEAENFDEIQEYLGFREDDVLAPCNRVDYKYRNMCYINHGKYFCAYRRMSMQDASRACLNAGDHIHSCIKGLGGMAARPTWQRCLMELSSPDPYREATLIENTAYLCDMVPSEYIESCHRISLSNLISYQQFQEAMDFCSLYWTGEKKDCFRHNGIMFGAISMSESEAIQKCEITPKEYRNNCIEGVSVEYDGAQNRSVQYNQSNEDQITNNQIAHAQSSQTQYNNKNQTISDEQPKTSSSPLLPYLFIGLGFIFLLTPVAYYLYRRK